MELLCSIFLALAEDGEAMSLAPSPGPVETKAGVSAGPFFAFEDCSVVFGGLAAVKDVSFQMGQGDCCSFLTSPTLIQSLTALLP